MKTVKFLFLSSLFAACAPAGAVTPGTPAPAGCVTDIPCEEDRDCAAGTRCNTRLPSPRCQNLQCGPDGSLCSNDTQCRSRICAIGGFAMRAEPICVSPLSNVARYQLCEGLPIGAPCGPNTRSGYENGETWECRNDKGLPGGAAQCSGGVVSGPCPPGPNGAPGRSILVRTGHGFACHFECLNDACPAGFSCISASGGRFCLPSPVQ
jgi:hypothetical protein